MSKSLTYIINTPAHGIRSLHEKRPATQREWTQKRIVCKDGANLSVQASAHHYCTPRNDKGPWTHVEVGFPSVEPPASWKEYAETPESLTDSVFGYIPVELVREFIDLHGGEL